MVGPPTYPAPMQHTTREKSHESIQHIVSIHSSPLPPLASRDVSLASRDLDRNATARKIFRETTLVLIAPLSSTPRVPRARHRPRSRDHALFL